MEWGNISEFNMKGARRIGLYCELSPNSKNSEFKRSYIAG